jgi:acyl-homoserine-lactone acylase
VNKFLKSFALFIAAISMAVVAWANGEQGELNRWKKQAQHVQIIRDNWGIPHVYGDTDADAVFGVLYAQAEDNFNRIEFNYINAMGRLAEVEGESALYSDLRMKLFIDPADMQAKYAASPVWLKKLMNSFADGLNYYLYTHPDVHPKLLTHFEPWMALCFSEGSIGGDIEEIDLKKLEQFYGGGPTLVAENQPEREINTGDTEPGGSNGFAIAPSLTIGKHALLLINPHTSFYFRPEVHMVSKQGLNAYGAVTWGQFFIYQGFNSRLGWMHTSGGANVINEYLETVTRNKDGDGYEYRYGAGQVALKASTIRLRYKSGAQMAEKEVTVYYSQHGPIVRKIGDQWVAVRLMQEPVKALMQSYSRTLTKNYAEFYQVMELRTNSSNNTVYADADGNIAYFHGNFVPKRDTRFDWSRPVDGSNPATEWHGLHEVNETITLKNPKNGWIQNTNNWPFTAAGAFSPRQQDYPAYMSVNPENARGIHAVRVLENRTDFTLDSLISTAYDSYLPAFEVLMPALLKAWDDTPEANPLRSQLKDQIDLLRHWDLRFANESVPTALAIYWGQDMMKRIDARAKERKVSKGSWAVFDFIVANTSAQEKLESLLFASARLEQDFGSWKTPWGEINRFQHVSGAIDQVYDDAKPSLPVPFTASVWGSLAAFGATSPGKTRHIYGDRGNSFVAVVEFGPKIHAKSVLAGGESGDPASPHFNDQAGMYSRGEFKDVLFYPEDVKKHSERSYHPGQ